MNDAIRQKILNSPTLPTLPAIAVKVLELAQQDEVDLNEIAKAISQDPALSGKILKTVNSSFYGRSHAVATISHALVILGLQSVKTLVLSFSLVSNLSGDRSKTFDHMKYWRRSIFAATATRLLCAKVGFVQTEEAFLATLLADIGVLVLEKVLGEEYHVVHAGVASHRGLAAAERAAFGTAHTEVGGLVAGTWKLPPLLVAPITAHHEPGAAGDPQLTRLAQVVGIGGRCADVFVDENPAPAIVEVRQTMKALFEKVDADALLAEIGAKTREVASLFEISLNGANLDFTAIMKRANERLVELNLLAEQQSSQLQQQNAKLKERATTDRLTGLANRATFDEFVADAVARSLATREPLSLVMIDVDKFKAVNDAHGHPAGDAVLRHLGALVKGMARDCDLAARYGGEELILVLPGIPRAMAATVAETVRQAIAARPVTCGPLTIPITASFGVAAIEPGAPFRTPANLLKAADLALYKAKQSGRNNVKVFAPPTAASAPPAQAAKGIKPLAA